MVKKKLLVLMVAAFVTLGVFVAQPRTVSAVCTRDCPTSYAIFAPTE